MAESLDALFGAFDGNEGETSTNDYKKSTINGGVLIYPQSSSPFRPKVDKKKQKMQNETTANKMIIADETRAISSSTIVNSSGTSNMTPSNIRAIQILTPTSFNSTHDDSKNEERKEDSLPQKEEERAIATGTSHDKSIRSYTALPDSEMSFSALTPSSSFNQQHGVSAKTYSFALDPFQAQAISYITQNQSVLVSAHTSAGKTVVAEYAIAQSLKEGQRVIYTSPIKALSNQKYRDLHEEFTDVGLMTGDITINPSATCLVMTTEILRSMLYRGSELMREVAWVVFDEVHYMRDKERGVVWEESIVLLPHKVRFVFLSATIPNSRQFAHWIAKIHHQPCHVVYTNYRPTPLQHYVFAAGGDGLHLVVDEKGTFREANFQKAMAALKNCGGDDMEQAIANQIANSGNAKSRKRKTRSVAGRGGNTDLHRIVKLVMERNLNPVIIFSFSKKDCEKYALELNKEDYTDEVEKDLISQVYQNAIESLGEDDRALPQVEALLPLLKKGIGIHHGGLLPILKEIVEILFSEGLIKALFATETFAIGINMPAKTVIFTNTRKWDGKDFRWVTSGEYIQMSGRAGRRGKDDRGIVIQMMDEKMEPSVCKGILYGDPDPLNSSYRISYNMLLNMMRVEDVDPEYLLKASFHQFQQESEAPALETQADAIEVEARTITIGSGPNEEEKVGEYYRMNQQLLHLEGKVQKIARKSQYVIPFLQTSGRMLKCSINGENYGWGVMVSYKKKLGTGSAGSAGKTAAMTSAPEHVVEVLLICVDKQFDNCKISDVESEENKTNIGMTWRGNVRHFRPAKKRCVEDGKTATMRVFKISLENIDELSAVRLFIPNDIQSADSRRNVANSVKEVQRRFPEGIPILDAASDLGVKCDDFVKLSGRCQTLKERLAMHSLCTDLSDKSRQKMVRNFSKKADLLEKVKAIRKEARACQGMVMRDELKKMKRVLRQLGGVDANGVIQMKGRTACEINTANELVVVELIFCGVFNDLTVEQSVSLLSCMTFDEKIKNDDDNPTHGMKSFLSNPFYKLQDCARTVAKATIACKIEIDEDEFLNSFNPGLMEAVFAWCKGAKFVDVQKLTGTFEGTTIRTLRRLEELVRQLSSAAKAIGNHELQAKFEKGSELLKRDIVFCSSLYL